MDELRALFGSGFGGVPGGPGAMGVGWVDALVGVLAAFVFGQVLAFAYERTFRGVSYARGFTQTIVLVSVASSTFVMAIGRSLYAGLGLLGVLSMIRFRANLRAPRDLVFLLGAATAGVASGVDALAVAAVGSISFAAVALGMSRVELGSRREYDGVLRFTVPATQALDGLMSLLDQHCDRVSVLAVGEIAQGDRVEHTLQVRLRGDREKAVVDLVGALRSELGVDDARVLIEEASLEY